VAPKPRQATSAASKLPATSASSSTEPIRGESARRTLTASGTTPASETSPRVGLIADVPESAEGIRRKPAVSVPVATGTIRAASAAAEPPLEPPADRSSAHGFPTWSVVPPIASSCVWRWPSRMAPAEESRAQTSLSRCGTSASTRLNAVSGFPATA
jgi:hypothetical protein